MGKTRVMQPCCVEVSRLVYHCDEENSEAADSTVLLATRSSAQPYGPAHHPHHRQYKVSNGEHEDRVDLEGGNQ